MLNFLLETRAEKDCEIKKNAKIMKAKVGKKNLPVILVICEVDECDLIR